VKNRNELKVEYASVGALFDMELYTPAHNNLAGAEPRIQLNAEECCNTGMLNFQIISVLRQLLHLIKLFPECFRKAAKTICQFKDTIK
jgi:hypothetical protein